MRLTSSPTPTIRLSDTSDGEPDLAANVPLDLFPVEAFKEALELTSGMPYSRRGAVKLIIEMLDEVSPKHVLKEFNDEIKKLLARK